MYSTSADCAISYKTRIQIQQSVKAMVHTECTYTSLRHHCPITNHGSFHERQDGSNATKGSDQVPEAFLALQRFLKCDALQTRSFLDAFALCALPHVQLFPFEPLVLGDEDASDD